MTGDWGRLGTRDSDIMRGTAVIGLSRQTHEYRETEGAAVAMERMGGSGPTSQILPPTPHTPWMPEAQAWEQEDVPQEAQVLTKRTG